MLLGVLDGDLVLANTIVNGHSEVGNGGEGGDEGSQDVKQAFLLGKVSIGESCKVSVELENCLQLAHGRPLRRRQWRR